MKKILILLSCALCMAACDRNAAVISGTFGTSDGDTIFLRMVDKPEAVDTIVLPSSGEFKAKKTLLMPTFYELTSHNQSVTLVIRPGDRVRLSADAANLTGTFSVQGSQESADIFALNERMRRTLHVKDSIDVLYRITRDLPKNESYQGLLMESYVKELQQLRKESIRFVTENKASMAALYALYQKVTPQTYVFSEEDDIQYFQMVDSCLFKLYPKVPLVNMLHRNVQEMTTQLRNHRLGQMLAGLGDTLPDVAAQNRDGNQVALSSMPGKYVLLYFCATWNEASLEWIPTLKQLAAQYAGSPFEICQISFDYTYASWVQMLDADPLPWTCLWEPKGLSSELAGTCKVDNLPMLLLVDPDRMIIGRRLTPATLTKKLEEVLSQKE